MQGRLSTSASGRIQEFPHDTWQREFALAADCGFDAIEWVFEADRHSDNPMWTAGTLSRIEKVAAESGVRVSSICADYFMAYPLTAADVAARRSAVQVLGRLVEHGAHVGVERIVIPLVDSAAVRTPAELDWLEESLSTVIGRAAEAGVELALETELGAPALDGFLRRFEPPGPSVVYDLGNSAALGYDAPRDLRALAGLITEIHVKDRVRGGGTVPLGAGDADLPAAFATLRDIGFAGLCVLQGAPGPRGREVETVRGYLRLVREIMRGGEARATGRDTR